MLQNATELDNWIILHNQIIGECHRIEELDNAAEFYNWRMLENATELDNATVGELENWRMLQNATEIGEFDNTI